MKQIAINTIGVTGARIDKKESPSKVKLVFIVKLIVVQFSKDLISVEKENCPAEKNHGNFMSEPQ
jgi:hypothetical protein